MQRSAPSIRRCPIAHVMLGVALVLCASARRIAAQSVPAHAPDSISSVLWDSYATAPGDSISGPVLRTFVALHGHPSILTAYPLSMDNLSRIHDTRAKAQAGAPRSPALTPVLPPELRAARGSRRRHEIIGAVVGAAAGLLVYAVNQHGCRSQNGIPCGLGAGNELMILVGGGALGGALLGAALPHGP